MVVCWVCPDPEEFISGGNLYNRRLIEALQTAGYTCLRLDWQGFARNRPPWADLYLLDSLYLEDFNDASLHSLPGKLGLLCHYLPELNDPHADLSRLRPFDLLISPSDFLYHRLKSRLGGATPEVWVIPPVLELFAVENIEPLWPPLVLVVANLVEEKGVLPLLRQLNKIFRCSSLLPDFQMEIYGSGHLDQAYAQACRRLLDLHPNLGQRVVLCESIPPRQLMQRYQQATLLVSASYFETFGMAVAEAIALQLPVFALASGNLPYLIDHPSKGRLFENLPGLCRALLPELLHPRERQVGQSLHKPPFSASQAVEHWLRCWRASDLF